MPTIGIIAKPGNQVVSQNTEGLNIVVYQADTFQEGIDALYEDCDFFVWLDDNYTMLENCINKYHNMFNEYTGIVYSNGQYKDGVIIYNEPYSRVRLEQTDVVCDVVMVSKEALETNYGKYDEKSLTRNFVAKHIPEILWQIDLQ